jgi:putative endonuclease
MNANHLKGNFFEFCAMLVLIAKCYRPLQQNIQTPYGETDLVAQKNKTIHVIEVKYRKSRDKSHVAIHPNQRDRLINQAKYHLKKEKWAEHVSLDVMLFYPKWPFFDHIKNVWDIE